MTHRPRAWMAAALVLLLPTAPVIAQTDPPGAARSSVGTIGQRQTRSDVTTNAMTLGRINGRLENRVPSRLQTRLDRNYDRAASVSDRIQAAADQARRIE